MSIHAHPIQEAEAWLTAQKRNSMISSIVISVLAVVMIALVLGVFLLPGFRVDHADPDVTIRSPQPSEEIDKPKPEVRVRFRSNPLPPFKSPARALTVSTVSRVSIPVPDIDVIPPSAELGDGDFGDHGTQGILGRKECFMKMPPEMSERCSKEDRIARLQEMGGRSEAEEVVEKGLQWLKASQNSDGSWTGSNRAAMTGFAVLAYLGRCETPISEKHGESCLRGITYLVDFSKFDYLGKDSNLYSQYYDSQAMMARGGGEWRKYN